MLGDELFHNLEDAIDLRAVVEIDRTRFLLLYADLARDRGSADEQHIRYAESLIDGFIDRVESILGSYRLNRSCMDMLLGCPVGRVLWHRCVDRLRVDIHDCITGYVEDLCEGKENEREMLHRVDELANRRLSELYHILNDEEYLLELALAHSG